MVVQIPLKHIGLPPGQRVLLRDVSWQKFEEILQELGQHRGTRLAYSREILEIMSPLPEHEIAKVVIGDLLKVLLDELDMNWESLGSTTFQREEMQAGIEPDDCFYIQNHALVIGRKRIDLAVDPPPDLAIEVDVTSKTQLRAYEALGIPEIWVYQNQQIRIHVLREGRYVESPSSPTFPDFPAIAGISQFLEMSRTSGTAPALRAFRKWVREQVHLS
jgi:Uma2 family endonuclease